MTHTENHYCIVFLCHKCGRILNSDSNWKSLKREMTPFNHFRKNPVSV